MMLTAQADAGTAINLSCSGGGSANKAETSTAYAADSNGNSGWAAVNHHRSEGFDDQVDLRIDGENSRIRLPRTMLPPIHGGDNGWFKVKNLKMDGGSIEGAASVNPLNSPKFHIDRHTGRISIDGKAGHFTGSCERSAATDEPAKF